jgi:hypothetical protein
MTATFDGEDALSIIHNRPTFRESIAPAVLDDLGAGVFAMPVNDPFDALKPALCVRVKGRFVTIRNGETWDAIIDRIREVWDAR